MYVIHYTDHLINTSYYYNWWEGQKQPETCLAWIPKVVEDDALLPKFLKYETSSYQILIKINENLRNKTEDHRGREEKKKQDETRQEDKP